MNLRQTFRDTLGFWHNMAAEAVAECSPEMLHRVAAGSTANPIAATYAHIVMTEDLMVQNRLRSQPTIFESGGWAEPLGVSFIGDPPLQKPEWLSAIRLDPGTFAPYATAVFESTDAYLAAMPDADLDRQVMGIMRETTAGNLLMLGVVVHFVSHAGEIAAIKGTFGMKGLPF